MRLAICLAPFVVLTAACATARQLPDSMERGSALPALPSVTHVVLTDATSGARLGTVARPDSVAALSALYGRLRGEWVEGAAAARTVAATFYQDSTPTAVLVLASGAFETRVGGRVLRRTARPDEALAFARLAGLPLRFRAGVAAAVPASEP